MATALNDLDLFTGRRREIESWYSSLATRTDAELLQVASDATPAQLKAAFGSLARRFHPDAVAAADEALRRQLQSIFIRVSEAYRNLSRRSPHPPMPKAAPAPRVSSSLPQAAPAPRVSPSLSQAAPAPRVSSSPPDEAARRARVEAALRAAEALVTQGQAETAVSVLHEVLTQADEPRRRRIRLLLARAYASEARWRRNAVALLHQLIEQNPTDAEALTAIGSLYQREGLLSRAESMFVRAVAADRGFFPARDGLRSVRAALDVRHTPSRTQAATRRGLMVRLFSVAR